ncbi:Hpt domain-containing protein, partial [Azohydromonas aeria]|uniref:Hpt domain-containing protein n=1 Tax=Azohydromonas aeria TaxID=2590212 RepID=UPI0018DEF31F
MNQPYDDDAAIIAAAREGFLAEAQEMLQQFEQSLLGLEQAPGDSELLNAAFRAAHTIKGTAGLFGFDALVAFTHEVETLMEALRSGALQADEAICAALLESLDQMQVLLGEVELGSADPVVAERSAVLGAQLRALLQGGTAAPRTQPQQQLQPASVRDAPATGSAGAGWQVAVGFGADALRNGLDPLAFIRYLARLGSECSVATRVDAVPALEALDAESCHLGFDIRLMSEAPRAEVEGVFEFALDDCELRIDPLAPQVDAAAAAPAPVPAGTIADAAPAEPAAPAAAEPAVPAAVNAALAVRRQGAAERRGAAQP